MKYHCLNPIARVGLNVFGSNHATNDYVMTEDMADADAVLVRSASMHELDLPANLKAIARAGAGYNNIPVDRCSERGIVVFNTPGANANGVKELAIAGLMLASRDIVGGINWVQTIKDEENVSNLVEKGKGKFAGREILGKKLGVIGLGATGGPVANVATHLGMDVYGCDPYISVRNAWNLSRNVISVKTREEIYRECDYISLHAILTDENKKMIDMDAISLMKEGVVILNFSRDLLVDDDAMEEALNSGKVARYVTDFPNNKTANMNGAIAIPHLGASTEESEDNCAVMAARQIKDFLENGNITNSVNYPALDAGECQSAARIAINHKNIPNMLTQFTGLFSAINTNIENMMNKSHGDYAYTVIDVSTPAGDDIIGKIAQIRGVLKVRVV